MSIEEGVFTNSPDPASIFEILAELLGQQEGVDLTATVTPVGDGD